ncbi:MAG: 16S rRNA (guanine(966)-N(2))-methyltransferase RsmD [Clostridia bacterium]|nr:16S rRNA (guanine(966)-N(2))-methyltransferase RsmD [Clostridia bacterium]
MRIIGGIHGGRILTEFENIGVRPTSDMVRESLFNILRDRIEDATFLDLFCGTGAVGIEALSRGARHVTFNDNNSKSLECLNKNLNSLKITDGYSVSIRDGLAFLQSTTQKFDIIYLDPPYATDLGESALNYAINCLADNGVIVYETDKVKEFDIDGLYNYDTRKYGRNVLYFFERKKSACVFAGTFDPITKGHQNLIDRCIREYQKVVVTLGENDGKVPFFTNQERLEFLTKLYGDNQKVVIANYHELKDSYAEFLTSHGVKYFVRGIRNDLDAIYENASVSKNKKLYPFVETVFIKADKKYKKISSSIVREYIEKGKDITSFIPEQCKDAINFAISKRKPN